MALGAGAHGRGLLSMRTPGWAPPRLASAGPGLCDHGPETHSPDCGGRGKANRCVSTCCGSRDSPSRSSRRRLPALAHAPGLKIDLSIWTAAVPGEGPLVALQELPGWPSVPSAPGRL